MTINDKIKQILIDKNLTPSYFADEIGVQRSSISHILSGRNRPSFDIIQKIIRRFPDLGYEWIMEEENAYGNSTPVPSGYSNRSTIRSSDRFSGLGSGSVTYNPPATTIRSQRTEIPPIALEESTVMEVPSNSEQPTATPEKKVEKILIFYTDGSFREYAPSK